MMGVCPMLHLRQERIMNLPRLQIAAICLALACTAHGQAPAAETPRTEAQDVMPIGVAKIDITPTHPVRLTGYGNRTTESEGVAQHLWAKALALGGDDGDGPAVLITVDNCGITPEISEAVARQLQQQSGIKRPRLVISVSHTHAGPSLTNWAPFLFSADVSQPQQDRIDQYTRQLTGQLIEVARQALGNRRDGYLFWTQGQVGFAANRRVVKDESWTGFGVQPRGPVDHRLPVLVAQGVDGQRMAVVANYACHCTTTGGDFNQIAGDWAGYAQEYIQQDHEPAVALITIGCGADANPEPRGSLDMCRQHARALADEVKRLLASELKPLGSRLDCRLVRVELPFDQLPTREQWQQRSREGGVTGYHASKFLQRLDRGEAIPTELTYPVAAWNFADRLAMVFLGGEVVVDYALRLSQEFDADRLWVTAYANDVPCYIPSRRILREGGYEADSSMLYYARPTRFAPDVEDIVIQGVRSVLPAEFRSGENPGR